MSAAQASLQTCVARFLELHTALRSSRGGPVPASHGDEDAMISDEDEDAVGSFGMHRLLS